MHSQHSPVRPAARRVQHVLPGHIDDGVRAVGQPVALQLVPRDAPRPRHARHQRHLVAGGGEALPEARANEAAAAACAATAASECHKIERVVVSRYTQQCILNRFFLVCGGCEV